MKCPFCRSTKTDVYNTRTTKFGTQIWRRRRCLQCQESFTTYEAADLGFLRVSQPGQRQTRPYSRAQLYADVAAAFLPHEALSDTLDALADTIEAKLLDLTQRTVTTTDITRIVLTTLKHFNTAAFVRYLTTHSGQLTSTELRKELGRY